MARVFLFGLAIAVLGALTVALSAALGINFQYVLVGLGGGAVLGLIRHGSPVARLGAFLIGLFAGLVFYLLRLAVLPANWAGIAVATMIAVLLLTLVAGLTKDRLPLWAMLLGVMVFSGGYEYNFLTTPWFALSQLPANIAGMLATASIGFLVALLVELREKVGGVDREDPMVPESAPPPPTPAGAPVGAAPAGPQVTDGSQGGQQ